MKTGIQTTSRSLFRRSFLGVLGSTVGGWGWLSASKRATGRDVGEMTATMFRPLVGTHFTLRHSGNRQSTVDLVEISANRSDTHRPRQVRRESFSLLFRSLQESAFEDQICVIEHPRIGKIKAFISSVERPQQGVVLQAVFG